MVPTAELSGALAPASAPHAEGAAEETATGDRLLLLLLLLLLRCAAAAASSRGVDAQLH